MQPLQKSNKTTSLTARINIWYGLMLFIMAVFLIRLFYLQIIKHDYYSKAALAGQLKQYEIPPERGIIEAHDGEGTVPIVLNETLYTLFADPKFIKNPTEAAAKVQSIIGGNAGDYEQLMKQDTRYAVLGKKLTKDQKQKLDALDIKGLGTRDEPHRTYPQDDLAAQVLGFVNDDGEGKYGVEQALDSTLKGSPGRLKAITDAQGVPLLSNDDNVIVQPKNGQSVLLTIDVSMQRQLQDILRHGIKRVNAKSGSAIIMDPNTGEIKAMANYPTYKPAEFYKVKEADVFANSAVSSPLEVGSIMKILTTSAALDQNVISTKTTYYDPNQFVIDGYKITNVEQNGGPQRRSIEDILQLSLNTGATWMLMQMGGGEVNAKARTIWHDYMVNHFQLGMPTGIEQGYEAPGTIPDPNKGFALDLQFANTAFGQGMTATPLQMAAALSSIINGGTYYRPRLIDTIADSNGKKEIKKPEIIKTGVIKQSVSKDIQALMQYVVSQNHSAYGMPNLPPAIYSIGGKTGTAQIPNPKGGYYTDKFNGTFIGFVGGNKPQYVIAVRVNEPHINNYAGRGAAAPIFSDLAMMLINNFNVTPK